LKVNENHMPTPDEVNTAPELAVLAVLDATLEAATRALVAAYPELCDDEGPPSTFEPVICGRRFLSRANKLQNALVRYRKAVLRERPKDSDTPADPDTLSAEAF
jgi:hypothetical protein